MSSDPERPIYDGSCFCGEIRFRFRGRPLWITYDHDSDCRKAIGAPLVAWVGYRTGDVEILSGKPTVYNSSPGIRRSFCGRCGTSITYQDDGLPSETYYTIGLFDEPEAFAPQAHAFISERLSWLKIADELPRFPGHSRERVARTRKTSRD